jgi:predicted transcriptional regulator of viral defense system
MGRASYVSCQSALAHYGLIPEFVPVTISLTTTRPTRWETPVGIFQYHHIKKDLFLGYQSLHLDRRQSAYVATPEKALLDLVYLTPNVRHRYLRELRLQHLEGLDTEELRQQAETSGSLKLVRAAEYISSQVISQRVEYESIPARIDTPGS